MTRILIVDAVHLSASLMTSVLDQEDELCVAGIATSVEEALGAVGGCDVMLVSTELPENGAFDLTARALEKNPNLSILVVGVIRAPQLILRHIEAGAVGYVLREDSVDDLVKNIHAIRHGRALVSPQMAAALMSRVSELADQARHRGVDLNDTTDLTPREHEVLELIGEGLTNKEIADRLFIEVGTVKNHVHNLLNKLNARGREEAALYLDALEKKKA